MIRSFPKTILLILLLLLAGCDPKNVDVTPPVMEVLSYSPEPAEDEICTTLEPLVFQLTNDQELTLDVIFKDEEALSQYKIDIHNNFDCHGHGGGSAPRPIVVVDNQTIDWTVLDIQNISGKEAPITRTLTVPNNVTAGNYHFHIQVIDESGNDSPFANFNSIKIKNLQDTIAPQISVEQPAMSNFSANKGDIIRFKGQVTDNRSLSDGGNGILYLAYTDLTTGNSFNTDKAFPFENGVDAEYNFDFEYTIPQTLVPRQYRFSLGANDGVRNVGEFIFFEVDIQ